MRRETKPRKVTVESHKVSELRVCQVRSQHKVRPSTAKRHFPQPIPLPPTRPFPLVPALPSPLVLQSHIQTPQSAMTITQSPPSSSHTTDEMLFLPTLTALEAAAVDDQHAIAMAPAQPAQQEACPCPPCCCRSNHHHHILSHILLCRRALTYRQQASRLRARPSRTKDELRLGLLWEDNCQTRHTHTLHSSINS